VDNRRIEPGLINIFRFYNFIAVVYFALIGFYFALETGETRTPTQIYSFFNAVTNLLLIGYLSLPWLNRKFKDWYLPVALVFATTMPVISNVLYLAETEADYLNIVITRSWLLLPILVVPLVLIAWQYQFRYVVMFIIFITVFNWIMLYSVVEWTGIETLQVLGIPLVVAFAFGAVGLIVNRLVQSQRKQRGELIQANLRLAEHAITLEELAISRERNRLARELHDTLAHTLSGLAVNLEAIRILIPKASDEVQTKLQQSLASTRAGLVETRRAMKDLRSKQLEDLGLRFAMQKISREAAERAGFNLDVNILDPLPEISPLIEQAVYRIAQEALENIVRHAQAETVRMELKLTDNELILKISDDGKGLDPGQASETEHMGLRGMQERAKNVGGRLEVISQPLSGTTISFVVKVNNDSGLSL
jgi:signal transduction histidine kinase